jgi:molybdate transport repressor ModE-like protein
MMKTVNIQPVWTLSDSQGHGLSHRLITLLCEVREHGSLAGACKSTGSSYRHAWNMIRAGEAQLGMALLEMSRGKGSTLTPLAEKLVWAAYRIQARLTPTLETLASEIEVELAKVMSRQNDSLKVQASHGFAVEKMMEALTFRGHAIERKYVGSLEALASLSQDQCELAGFHVPIGDFQWPVLQHYARWLNPKSHRVIHVATRRQGLMVAGGNPLGIQGLKDLTRTGVRFVNRQSTSGTYFLLRCLLKQAGIDAHRIQGFDQTEHTHAAAAAFVASGMADAAFGVETPSHRYGLNFLPLASEQYFLLCDIDKIDDQHLQAVTRTLSDPAFQSVIDALPGYSALQCGQVQTLAEAFPDHAKAFSTTPARRVAKV